MTVHGDLPYEPPVYLTTEELAQRWRTAASSLRDMRSRGVGPVGVKFGKKVLYDLDVVERYEAERIATEQREHRRRGMRVQEVS